MEKRKKFRFKFTPLIWALFSALIIIAIVGIIYNVIKFTKIDGFDAFNIILTIFNLCIFLGFLLVGLSSLIFSGYYIKGRFLYCVFGVVKIKKKILDITNVELFKKSETLVIYFTNNYRRVIITDKSNYDPLVELLKHENPNIRYEIL